MHSYQKLEGDTDFIRFFFEIQIISFECNFHSNYFQKLINPTSTHSCNDRLSNYFDLFKFDEVLGLNLKNAKEVNKEEKNLRILLL